jgi:hypothetical protein
MSVEIDQDTTDRVERWMEAVWIPARARVEAALDGLEVDVQVGLLMAVLDTKIRCAVPYSGLQYPKPKVVTEGENHAHRTD